MENNWRFRYYPYINRNNKQKKKDTGYILHSWRSLLRSLQHLYWRFNFYNFADNFYFIRNI